MPFPTVTPNATAVYVITVTPYYKLKINYLDPDYAKLMGLSTPVPTPLPRVRCPINLDGYSQRGARTADQVFTDRKGNASFLATVPAAVVVAATATRLDNGQPVATSELSQAVRVGK
jgi:hypothetical protein